MTTACPMCGRMLDPARAKETRTVDGKVVALCSATCARAFDRGVAPVLTVGSGPPSTAVPAGRTGRRRMPSSTWRNALAKAPPGAELETPADDADAMFVPAVNAFADDDAPPPVSARASQPAMAALGAGAGVVEARRPAVLVEDAGAARPVSGRVPVVAEASPGRSGAIKLPGVTVEASPGRSGPIKLPGVAPATETAKPSARATTRPPTGKQAPVVFAPSSQGAAAAGVAAKAPAGGGASE
ncbi:MAG TPA: hypothetical protein VHE35_31635, partial [Kofleriaceae bacterium]|nr:hypothetical protein [Kofleriaceae bacterium]